VTQIHLDFAVSALLLLQPYSKNKYKNSTRYKIYYCLHYSGKISYGGSKTFHMHNLYWVKKL